MYKPNQLYGDFFKIPFLDISNYELDKNITKLIPKNIAEKYKIIAIDKFDQILTIGITEKGDKNIIPILEEQLKYKIIPFLISLTDWTNIIQTVYIN